MSWPDLELHAPELARMGRERLEQARVALIGTLRKHGSPRISPIEPFFCPDGLLFGAMTWSSKARDLRRDPRCVVHTAITSPDAAEPEFKLYGQAVEASPQARDACREGWWSGRPPETVWVFSLRIETAVLIEWDLEGQALTIRRWSPEVGVRQTTRTYP